MALTLAKINPENPAEIGSYPATLPVEIALRVDTVPNICKSYGISQTEWDRIRHDPVFVQDLKKCLEDMKQEGMSFKMKARLQSDALLTTMWNMIHAPGDEVPPQVKADLAKFTIRAAGLDGSKDQAKNVGVGTALQINIDLR
jgi:hypothetical protein